METSLHCKIWLMETRYFDSEKKKCGLHRQKRPMETSLHCQIWLMETRYFDSEKKKNMVSIAKNVRWRPVSIVKYG